MDDYKVQLESFEGPLDLLLYLIRKEDLDIYDIPVAKVLEQYLDYINLAEELNIDLAGEFIEMASELALIKSRMLLPEPETEEEEGPDPRADLVARLLEYQRFKLAGQSLLARPLLNRDVFRRSPDEHDVPDGEDLLIQADMISLLSAFQNLIKRIPKERVHEIHDKGIAIGEKIIALTERLRGREQVSFDDLFESDTTRVDFVTTFLAVLQMAKQGLLQILQERTLHKIYIRPKILETPVLENSEGEGAHHGT